MGILEFYKNKIILVTGHTGFKGSWLSTMLQIAGAKVVGYALKPEEESLYALSKAGQQMQSIGIFNTCNQFFRNISRNLCFIWQLSLLYGQVMSSQSTHMRRT